jgi:hypothetical protein
MPLKETFYLYPSENGYADEIRRESKGSPYTSFSAGKMVQEMAETAGISGPICITAGGRQSTV